MSVLTPDSLCRMRSSVFGSTAITAASVLSPYTTAGIFPAARTRRASFLPRVSRFVASSTASINPLHEQRRDRRLLVNTPYRLPEQARHRQGGDLRRRETIGRLWDRVGHDQLLDRRRLDAFDR